MAKKFRKETEVSSMKYHDKLYLRFLREGMSPEEANSRAWVYTVRRAEKYGAILVFKKIAQLYCEKAGVPRQARVMVYAFVNEAVKAIMEADTAEDIVNTVDNIYRKHANRVGDTVIGNILKQLHDFLTGIDFQTAGGTTV